MGLEINIDEIVLLFGALLTLFVVGFGMSHAISLFIKNNLKSKGIKK